MLVFHVASGQSFFTGAACLIGAACLAATSNRGYRRVVRNTLVFLGGARLRVRDADAALGLCPPVCCVSGLVGRGSIGRTPCPDRCSGLRVAVVTVWLVAVFVELPYHLTPRVPRLGHPAALGIIGDSVTAGIGGPKDVTWAGAPRETPRRCGPRPWAGGGRRRVRRAASGLGFSGREAHFAGDRRDDLLGGTTPSAFEAGLAKLLAAVRRPGRVVVMLELPLPPTYNAFGRIQRRLARRYNVLLVPKRVLLGVLQRQGTTLDSIHLSPEGHQDMADAIWKVVREAYDGEG